MNGKPTSTPPAFDGTPLSNEDIEAQKIKIGRLVAGIHRSAQDRAMFLEGMRAGEDTGHADMAELARANVIEARSCVRTCRIFTWLCLWMLLFFALAGNVNGLAKLVHTWMGW
jgi:hypothetical protein